MDFAVYPFKRKNKYRLYIKFTDKEGKRRAKSTGISYPLDASQKQRKRAKKKAEVKALTILSDYLDKRHEAVEKENQAPLLSTYLENYYYPHVRSSCAESTLVSYQNALNHSLSVCSDKPLDQYKRSIINRYKLYRYDEDGIRKTTIHIEMRSIKAAFSWAYKNDFVTKSPFKEQDFF